MTILRFMTISTGNRARRSRTSANALRTFCKHKRNDFRSPPGPLNPNLKTGTLLRSIREKPLQGIQPKQSGRSIQNMLEKCLLAKKAKALSLLDVPRLKDVLSCLDFLHKLLPVAFLQLFQRRSKDKSASCQLGSLYASIGGLVRSVQASAVFHLSF